MFALSIHESAEDNYISDSVINPGEELILLTPQLGHRDPQTCDAEILRHTWDGLASHHVPHLLITLGTFQMKPSAGAKISIYPIWFLKYLQRSSHRPQLRFVSLFFFFP